MKKFILFSILFLIIAITFGSIYFLLPEILVDDQSENLQVNNKISSEEARLNELGQSSDTTAEINKNLQEIEIGDLDKEFMDIDNDIKNL